MNDLKKEYRIILIQLLSLGWSLDFADAVGIYGNNYQNNVDKFNEMKKYLEDKQPLVGISFPHDVFEEIVQNLPDDDKLHYTNPRSGELMSDLFYGI